MQVWLLEQVFAHWGVALPALMHLYPVVLQHFCAEQSLVVVLAHRSRSFLTACLASISARVSVSSTEADVWYDVSCSAAEEILAE